MATETTALVQQASVQQRTSRAFFRKWDFIFVVIFVLMYTMLPTVDFYFTNSLYIPGATLLATSLFYIFAVGYVIVIFIKRWKNNSEHEVDGTESSFLSFNELPGSKVLLFQMLVTYISVTNDISNHRILAADSFGTYSPLVGLLSAKLLNQGFLLLIGFFPSKPSNSDTILFARFEDDSTLQKISRYIHITSVILYFLVFNALMWAINHECNQISDQAYDLNIGIWLIFIMEAFFVSIWCCINCYDFRKFNIQLLSITLEMLLFLSIVAEEIATSLNVIRITR